MLKNKSTRRDLKIRGAVEQATSEQERRILAAVNLFLADWVRQRLAEGESHVQQRR
jgi:uncharacterized protein YqiB (DUF1249 family)